MTQPWERVKSNTFLRPKQRFFPSLIALLAFWGLGINPIWTRLTIEVDGIVISERDIPSTGAPRYSTEYALRGPDGHDDIYIAGPTLESLPRSLPVGTYLKKQRWHFEYYRNGYRVNDFVVWSRVAVAAVALGWLYLIWSSARGPKSKLKVS